jgi:hypothetical protein
MSSNPDGGNDKRQPGGADILREAAERRQRPPTVSLFPWFMERKSKREADATPRGAAVAGVFS